jgi:hypothetical protein
MGMSSEVHATAQHSVEIAGDVDEDKERRGTSLASAMRELGSPRHRIEAIGGSKTSGRLGYGTCIRSSGICYGLVSRPSGRRCHVFLQRGTTRRKG